MSKNHKQNLISRSLSILFLYLVFFANLLFAFEETITVPAEAPQGVTLDLEKGEYTVKIEGGAITLFYPINPNYRWLIGVAVGADAEGGQDEPDIGTLYFEPDPPAYSQAEAERQAVEASEENAAGSYLDFVLEEDKTVRFWVSDFDHTDNSGMIKLKIRSNKGGTLRD